MIRNKRGVEASYPDYEWLNKEVSISSSGSLLSSPQRSLTRSASMTECINMVLSFCPKFHFPAASLTFQSSPNSYLQEVNPHAARKFKVEVRLNDWI
jgi:hypothetical protein